MIESLTSAQLSKLKSLAQRLDPTLKVGKQGLSDSFLQTVDDVLQHHELIKVKFGEFKEEKAKLAPLLAAKTSSQLVTLIGHVAVLYRQHPDPTKRQIKL